MKYYNGNDALVIKSWCNNPEDSALDQAKNLAKLPFAYGSICLMPDTHAGYGMPIGGVLATKDVVIPNAVGVDVGCGMCVAKTNLHDLSTDTIKRIVGEIRKVVPLGFNHHKEPQPKSLMPEGDLYYQEYYNNYFDKMFICERNHDKARESLGTLGGGNHFIEIQKDSRGIVWIMIHSGSRNLGKQVADHYNRLAIELNESYYSNVPKEWQLAFLPINFEEGEKYIQEMDYCVKYAKANRKLMMTRIMQCFVDIIPDCLFSSIDGNTVLDVVHNYARMENHFGHNLMVHRKGATSARKDEYGIIPGSQGTASYIVKGLGNPDSFMSCSHGAGRKMGRKEAKRTLNLDSEKKKLDDLGIVHGIRSVDDLEEACSAYKDIDVVMEEQKDLVEIVERLKPLGLIKG
jgi:tRNA-splicing ligase RtcB